MNIFFFFKQKTAYEIVSRDWSSDVCSSDLPFFSNWCMDLLITQLYDQSRNVSMRSLSVLNEACEDQVCLSNPPLLHLLSFPYTDTATE